MLLEPGLRPQTVSRGAGESHRYRMTDQCLSLSADSRDPKNNYNGISDGLCGGLKVNKFTEMLTIKSLRSGLGDRIDIVYADKDEANKAKQHTR
jgi:hypothetical protein